MQDAKIPFPCEVFGLIPKDGGFQLVRVTIDKNGKVVKNEAAADPDAWDQTMYNLELELSKKFA